MGELRAGDLDRRVKLLRAGVADDGMASTPGAFAPFAEVWAQALPVSDGERLRAAAQQASIAYRFRIRWSATVRDLGPADRIQFDGRIYGISNVKEIGRREGLEITASAVVAAPPV